MGRKVLRNCVLLDGLGGEPLHDAVLVVEDGCVSWVGPAHAWEGDVSPDGIVDMKSSYVMPGIWDMHLHLAYRDLKDVSAPATVPSDTMFSYRRALTFLNAGVTTLRLVSSHDEIDFVLRDGVNSGEFIGPRIFTAGQGIASTGGHGSRNGLGYDGPYEFRRAAREVVWRGADLVKIMVTGGISGRNETYDSPQTLKDEVEAAIEVAHDWGKHVAGHVASADAAIMCARAGMDTIEHGYALNEEAIKVMKECGAAYVPTAVVTDNPEYWERIGTATWAVNKIRLARDGHRRSIQMAMDAGIPISIGTDIPTAAVDGVVVTIWEMEALVGLGASPRDVIKWATVGAARICGVENEVSTLTCGKRADLIAVPGNPYDDISHLRDVRFVMSRGSIVRNDLAGTGVSLLAGVLENYPLCPE